MDNDGLDALQKVGIEVVQPLAEAVDPDEEVLGDTVPAVDQEAAKRLHRQSELAGFDELLDVAQLAVRQSPPAAHDETAKLGFHPGCKYGYQEVIQTLVPMLLAVLQMLLASAAPAHPQDMFQRPPATLSPHRLGFGSQWRY